MIYNIAAEQAVLGLVLKNSDVLIDIDLKSEHFFDKRHQVLFATMLKLMQEGKKIDIINISEAVDVREVGGVSYLADLITCADILLDKSKIEIIKEKYRQRKLYNMALYIKENISKKNFDELTSYIQKEIFIQENNTRIVEDKELFKEIFDELNKRMNSENKILGLRCNISALDAAINGFQSGKLYTIAARPAMGKSAVAINIANEISKKYHVLYISLEMTSQEIGFRRLAMEALIDSMKIERGIINEQEIIKLTDVANRLYNYKMMINDTPSRHIQDIYRECKMMKMRNKLDMLVVDHIGLVKADGDTLREQTTNIYIALKNIAKEFDIPVIALSQLSRAVEQRADKRPVLSDLKETSGAEENSDVVILLYRDEYYNPDTTDKGIIELNIGKQRGGRTGIIKLAWKGEYQLIRGIM